MDRAATDPGRRQGRGGSSRRRARGRGSHWPAVLVLPSLALLGGSLLVAPVISAGEAAAAVVPAAARAAAATRAPAPARQVRHSRRRDGAGHPRALPPPVIHLRVTDPNYSGGLQVDDTLTVTAQVTRGRIRPGGTVSFTTDEHYDRGCRPERLNGSSTAVCYITFYIPGPHRITARFVALDHRVAVLSIPLRLLSTTNS